MIRFFFFSFSSFSISTCCSFLPSVSPHTLHFFLLQVSIPPLATDPSPCPAPTSPTQAPAQHRQCWLISLFSAPYLFAISFFLYSVSQSFSVSNTKTHDRRCWVLILSPWLTKQGCHRDWVLCWWVLFLFRWMGFDFVDGWWMEFVDGWWMVAGFLWFRGGFWLIWWLMMGSIFILMNEFWFCWWLMNGGWVSLVDEWWWRWWWLWLWLWMFFE